MLNEQMPLRFYRHPLWSPRAIIKRVVDYSKINGKSVKAITVKKIDMNRWRMYSRFADSRKEFEVLTMMVLGGQPLIMFRRSISSMFPHKLRKVVQAGSCIRFYL